MWRKFYVLLVAMLALVACGSGAANPTLPSPAIKSYPSATFIATGVRPTLFKPLAKAECQTLNDSFAVAFRVSAGLSEAPFADPLNGDLGNGCLFDLKGTGEEFINLQTTLDNLRATLQKNSWLEDKSYAVSNPTSSATGSANKPPYSSPPPLGNPPRMPTAHPTNSPLAS